MKQQQNQNTKQRHKDTGKTTNTDTKQRPMITHNKHQDECVHETKVSHSSETKVSEMRFSCSSESKLSMRGCFSIFVGNIPPPASKRWLHRVFEPFGSIVDNFLSKKDR